MSDRNTDSQSDGLLAARLQDLLAGAWTTQAIYVAAELGLADLLVEGPRTSAELAALTASHEPSLRRLLHGLMAIDICRPAEHGRVELAPTGALLQTAHPASLHAWALWWGRSLWPAWGNLLHSVRTGESGRATQGFDLLATDPEAAALFYQATVELSRPTAPLILAAYDFSQYRRIVDVGGGYGELLTWILRAHPATAGVLFELPAALAGAQRHLAAAGVADRCEFVTGDFFVELPDDGDAYLVKAVLHDWNNERAARILAVCHRAMRPDARLLLIERIVSDADGNPPEQAGAIADLTMLVAHGAGERTRSQWTTLLDAAGFSIDRIVPVEGTIHLIEATARRPAAKS